MHSSAHNAWYISRANGAVFHFVIAVVAQLVAALTTLVSVLRHGLERIRSQVDRTASTCLLKALSWTGRKSELAS
jgi:ABC-type molybdate transport system permease subunit